MNLRETLLNARDDFVTKQEAAKLLPETSQRSIQNWAKAGRLRGAIQLPSGHWRIPVAALVELIEGDETK